VRSARGKLAWWHLLTRDRVTRVGVHATVVHPYDGYRTGARVGDVSLSKRVGELTTTLPRTAATCRIRIIHNAASGTRRVDESLKLISGRLLDPTTNARPRARYRQLAVGVLWYTNAATTNALTECQVYLTRASKSIGLCETCLHDVLTMYLYDQALCCM